MNLPACPFCGSTTLSVEPLASAWGASEESEHVICDTCAAAAPVDVWSKRHPDQADGK